MYPDRFQKWHPSPPLPSGGRSFHRIPETTNTWGEFRIQQLRWPRTRMAINHTPPPTSEYVSNQVSWINPPPHLPSHPFLGGFRFQEKKHPTALNWPGHGGREAGAFSPPPKKSPKCDPRCTIEHWLLRDNNQYVLR